MLARNPDAREDKPGLSDEANRYLDGVRTRGWRDLIHQAFAKADTLNILFVGETIIDEYRPVSALAKPSKEFIQAVVESGQPEQFLGGVVAASLHADWKNVTVVTDDGEPIKKTRFVDADFNRKVFEVYSKPRLEMSEERRTAFRNRLVTGMRESRVFVVFDFGHGLLGAAEREMLASYGRRFFAINAQTNAGNYGFNSVTKYKRADLVCIDVPEAQLAAGLQGETDAGRLEMAIDRTRLDFADLIITKGRHGATICPVSSDNIDIPAFGSRALDTMGAGDAFLAVTAPLVAAGLDLEAAAFVGNVAGAIKTDIVGHRRHVGRDELLQTVEALLA